MPALTRAFPEVKIMPDCPPPGEERGLVPDAYNLALQLLPGVDSRGRPTKGFETLADAAAEDATRLQLLRRVRSALRQSSRHYEDNAEWLRRQAPGEAASLPLNSDRLRSVIEELKAARSGETAQTLASAVFFREQRLLDIGGLLEALEPYADDQLRTFTLINERWRVDARTFAKLRAKTIIRQLRTHLERAGVNAIPGPLIAYLHGEFDPVSGLIQIHVHGATTAEKAEALHRLKRAPDGTPRDWGYLRTPTGSVPVRCDSIDGRVRQLSYLLKSFWPSRRILIGDDGDITRDREPQRIAEPIHTLVALWLARETIPSLRLLTGCRPLADGRLRLTDAVFEGAMAIP